MSRRRRHTHEDHLNHEAWAIPYADLLTLLLAFFVVMYAISSVNEGKYRVLSDALSAAFGGAPKTITPLQVGQVQLQGSNYDRPAIIQSGAKRGPSAPSPAPDPSLLPSLAAQLRANLPVNALSAPTDQVATAQKQLAGIAARVEEALAPLVKQRLVVVRRASLWLEVEIRSDILFASGSAEPGRAAVETVTRLAEVLRDVPNALRVEGYTDDRPIATALYPSNWELSAARAASVLHLFAHNGVEEGRMAVVGYGEHRPRGDNATEEGRGANRRVVLIILADPQDDPMAPPPTVVGDIAMASERGI